MMDTFRHDKNDLFDRIHGLVTARISGEITPDEFAELDALLAESAEARSLYVQYIAETLTLPVLLEVEGLPPERAGDVGWPDLPQEPTTIAAAGFNLGSLCEGPAFAYGLASFLVGLALLVGSLVQVSHFERVEELVSGQPSTVQTATVVGRITGMRDCRWKEGSRSVASGPRQVAGGNGSEERREGRGAGKAPIPNPKSLVALGDRFVLASGLLEMVYDSGAKVILQGPVTYEVDSATGGSLSVGKLTARVEKRGEEVGTSGPSPAADEFKASNPSSSPEPPAPGLFTIATPTATVTDLGTEFGVEVAGNGTAEAVVFEGRVRVALAGAMAGNGEAKVLAMGESVRVDDRRMEAGRSAQVLAGRFVRSIPSDADRYSRFVLSLHPSVYYRMERPQRDSDPLLVLDSASGGCHGELCASEDPSRAWRRGRYGDAIALQGIDGRQYVRVSKFPESTTGRLSISAWVWADSRPLWATIAKNWGSSVLGEFHFGLGEKDSDLHAFVSQADGMRIEIREGRDHPLPIGRWQHVALVVDDASIHLYRNGKEVAIAPFKGLANPSRLQALGIGCKLNDAGTEPDQLFPGYWGGRIDELAIFDEAISAETVRQLAALRGTPDSPETSVGTER